MSKRQKERYLSFKNMKIRNALSKLKLSFLKLAIVTGKWNKTKKKKKYANFVI